MKSILLQCRTKFADIPSLNPEIHTIILRIWSIVTVDAHYGQWKTFRIAIIQISLISMVWHCSHRRFPSSSLKFRLYPRLHSRDRRQLSFSEWPFVLYYFRPRYQRRCLVRWEIHGLDTNHKDKNKCYKKWKNKIPIKVRWLRICAVFILEERWNQTHQTYKKR
jgi:hypothetical protein